MHENKTAAPNIVVKDKSFKQHDAKFDALGPNSSLQSHWLNADALNPIEMAAPAIRKKARERCRLEFNNSPYCSGIVTTLAADTISTGPVLQLSSGDDNLDNKVEKDFDAWSRKINLPAKLRLMRQAKCVDGEIFGIIVADKRDTSASIDLMLVETENVCSPLVQLYDLYDGIDVDDYGRPTSYNIKISGDVFNKADYKIVPAHQVLHYANIIRPGQVRGLPEFLPALNLFACLRRYTKAVLTTAEKAANITYTIEANNTEDPFDLSNMPGASDGNLEFELSQDPNMAAVVPQGWSLKGLKPEQPTSTHSDFVKTIVAELARCLNVPYNVAALDNSGHSWATSRADVEAYYRSVECERNLLESAALNKLFASWLSFYVIENNLRNYNPSVSFNYPGRVHLDPQKEARAAEVLLSINAITLSELYSKRGKDWQIELQQRAKEKELMHKLGLTEQDLKVDDLDDKIDDKLDELE